MALNPLAFYGFGEGSGTTLLDEEVNHLTGRTATGLGWGVGAYGPAREGASFDGTGYASVSAAARFDAQRVVLVLGEPRSVAELVVEPVVEESKQLGRVVEGDVGAVGAERRAGGVGDVLYGSYQRGQMRDERDQGGAVAARGGDDRPGRGADAAVRGRGAGD